MKSRRDRFGTKFPLSQQVLGDRRPAPGSDELLARINAFLDEAKASGALNSVSIRSGSTRSLPPDLRRRSR